MALTPIVELGVAEAYTILTEHFGVTGLPPSTRSKMKTGGGTISSGVPGNVRPVTRRSGAHPGPRGGLCPPELFYTSDEGLWSLPTDAAACPVSAYELSVA